MAAVMSCQMSGGEHLTSTFETSNWLIEGCAHRVFSFRLVTLHLMAYQAVHVLETFITDLAFELKALFLSTGCSVI